MFIRARAVRFIREHPRVNSCALLGSLVSLGSFRLALRVLLFIWSRIWGHSGSFGRSLPVVGYILVHWIHSLASWKSLGSFGRALGVVGFILTRSVGRWFIAARRRVHSDGSLVSLGFVGFVRALPLGGRVNLR